MKLWCIRGKFVIEIERPERGTLEMDSRFRPSTFDVAAHKDKKTEDLAYLAPSNGLCIVLYSTSAKKAYVQSEKMFLCHLPHHQISAIPKKIRTSKAAAISDEPWTDEDIKKKKILQRTGRDWPWCLYLSTEQSGRYSICLSFGQLMAKVLDAYLRSFYGTPAFVSLYKHLSATTQRRSKFNRDKRGSGQRR